MKINDYIGLVVAVAVSELAGAISSFFMRHSIAGWYILLQKPALTPPNWVFTSVWITLYALMGVAAFLVWRKGFERTDVWWALAVFSCQLALNMFWIVIFFGLHNPLSAFVEILALWFMIFMTLVLFYRISRAAFWLMAPSIFWVSFAVYLNYMIWALNA